MVSVDLTEAEAAAAIAVVNDRVGIAAVNAPTTTVLAGEADALARIVGDLERRAVACQWLPVSYAFHSPQMDPLRAPLVEALRTLRPSRPHIALVSTVTGRLAGEGDFTAEYWGRNLREPVRLAVAVDALAGMGSATFVELGPHPVLGGALARTLEGRERPGVVLASFRRGQPADVAMLTLAGRLWQRGHDVEWSALYPGTRRWVALPPTPWQRESHPPRMGTPAAGLVSDHIAAPPGEGHSLLARRLATAQPIYETVLDREAPAYLADHRIDGVGILPATALIEMALHAGVDALGFARPRLDALDIRRPLPLHGGQVVQLTVSNEAADQGELRVFSRAAGDGTAPWILHATARLRTADAAARETTRPTRRYGEALQARAQLVREREAHYERLRGLGADFGPAFQGVRRIWCGDDEALARWSSRRCWTSPAPRLAFTRPCSTRACRWSPAPWTPRTGHSWCRSPPT